MLTVDGYICEGSGENIFFLKENKLYTPDPLLGALTGITQKAVIEVAAAMGIECVFARMKLDYIKDAEESFFTGTAAEIVPIVKIGETVIGSGEPGEVTRALSKGYRALTENEGQRY